MPPKTSVAAKRYAILVVRSKSGELRRQTLPAMGKRELLEFARELNPYDVVDVTIMLWGEILGVWRNGHEEHGVEAFAIACIGETTHHLMRQAAKPALD